MYIIVHIYYLFGIECIENRRGGEARIIHFRIFLAEIRFILKKKNLNQKTIIVQT